MDEIQHRYIEVSGLKLHVAEIGNGSKVMLFCHGFPDIWYSWHHQMIEVAKAGYRAIAPDHRGYGLSDPPPVPEKTTFFDLVNDLYLLLDALGICKVFLMAKDFGVGVAYIFSLLHPERVAGVVTLGAPLKPLTSRQSYQCLPEGFYISRWQSEMPIAGENQGDNGFGGLIYSFAPWFREEDLEIYGNLYGKSGFRTALQVYRSSREEFNSMPEVKVDVPALLIMGKQDYYLKFPGTNDFIRSEQTKKYAPQLETVYIPEGSHFVQ